MDTTQPPSERDGRSVSRRTVLLTGASSAGGLVGTASGSPTDGDHPGPLTELATCGITWDKAPPETPVLDLTTAEPTASETVPDDPDEIVIFAHGIDAVASGPDQGVTFERALEEAGYDHPVVTANWDASAFLFSTIEEQATAGGRRLASWLRTYRDTHPETTVRLVGLSIGTRTILTALETLDGDVTVPTAVLFGPSVPANAFCSDADAAFDPDAVDASVRKLYNYHSRDDDVICLLYPVVESAGGLGCAGLDCDDMTGRVPSAHEDVDVTESINSHCHYPTPDSGIVDSVVERFDENDRE